jgi:hypothetical protein
MLQNQAAGNFPRLKAGWPVGMLLRPAFLARKKLGALSSSAIREAAIF